MHYILTLLASIGNIKVIIRRGSSAPANLLLVVHVQAVGSALLRRKRLVIRCRARGGTDAVSEREICPKRLNHYRDNWYLDAWCHLRDGWRAFAVDAIEHAEILDRRAMDVADKRLDEVLGAGYGIFSGDQVAWTVLRFTAEFEVALARYLPRARVRP